MQVGRKEKKCNNLLNVWSEPRVSLPWRFQPSFFQHRVSLKALAKQKKGSRSIHRYDVIKAGAEPGGGVSGTMVLHGKYICQLYVKEELMDNRFSHKLASHI